MIANMLEMARMQRNGDPRQVPGTNPDLAREFASILSPEARRLTKPASRSWRCVHGLLSSLRADRKFPQDLSRHFSVAGITPDSIADLPDAPLTGSGFLPPVQALELQRRTGSEIAVDLVYHAASDRIGCFWTRGCSGGVCSDLLCYFWFSYGYTVLPVFHTHPDPYNELGFCMPSSADYQVLEKLRERLRSVHRRVAVGERVVFPDVPDSRAGWAWTDYGLDADGRRWYRHRGCTAQFLPQHHHASRDCGQACSA